MNLAIKEVQEENEYNVWYSFYSSIFPEAEDNFAKDFIWEWRQRPSETRQVLLLIENNSEAVGFIWQMLNIRLACCYYYYFGVAQCHRNAGIFSRIAGLNEKFLIDHGYDLILAEIKNPHSYAFGQEKSRATKRLLFYREKLKFNIVSDAEIIYSRHYPPNKLDAVQLNYLLGFKPLSKEREDKMLERGKIEKHALKRIYLNIATMELDIDNEKDLRAKSIAAASFLRSLENSSLNHYSLLP